MSEAVNKKVNLIELLKPYQEQLEELHFKMHEMTMQYKEGKIISDDNELSKLYKNRHNGKAS